PEPLHLLLCQGMAELCDNQQDVPLGPRCDLSLNKATCGDYSIHWCYDKQANSCAQFWYRGCGGNDNRFQKEVKCKKTCVLLRTGNLCCFYVHIYF
uniref:BPTI/Kunitz inhibitor domain-containing protein n=1 Tax=Acanthochromis polyacanthus TaxID=80966 RepID=A0A3Q1F6B5_9TELE